MQIYCHGSGSVSAAGSSNVKAQQTYRSGRSSWTTDPATGVPVYRIMDLPDHPSLTAFAAERAADRSTLLALYAAEEAVREAGWEDQDFAILVGCSRGPTQRWEEGYAYFQTHGSVAGRTSPQTTLGSVGFALADYFAVETLAASLSVTCSSGMHALLHGVALLRAGMAQRVLVGGTEAAITPFTLAMMQSLRICAAVPEKADVHACRPLAAPASGMALGEGAAFLALSLEPADYALSALAFGREQAGSATGITPDGAALQQTLRTAVAEGGVPDLVVAHAPGTRRGDAAEAAALRAVFGQEPRPMITSFKWATGHTFGASGPLGLAAALTALRTNDTPLTPIGGQPVAQRQIRKILVNATGFGGNTVTVGLRKQ